MQGKKLMYVITKGSWGGAGRYVYDLAHALINQYEITVVVGSNGLLVEKLESVGIRTILVPSLERDVHLASDITACIALFRLFNKERPEIVHLNSSKAGGLGAFSAYLAQVPKVIFTSHGLAYDEDRPYWQRILILVATWFTFFFAHKVILISQTTFERAKRLPLCSTKTELIYNGRSPIELVDSAQARKLLGIASENVHIGAIGELTKNKGYEYLLTAIAKVPRNISNFDLTIIGGGELEEKLNEIISRLQISDVVKLRGFIPDASKYLKAFDIFILPSLKEGLPYVLMEAGQASLATIGSNISGITDVLGKAGILVEPKDTDDIAEAIVKLTANADLRRKLGDELHARSQELFSIEVMVGKIAKLCYE